MKSMSCLLASLFIAFAARAAITASETVAVDSIGVGVTYVVTVANSAAAPVAAFVVDTVPVTITNLSAVVVSGGGSVSIDHLSGSVWWTGVSVPANGSAVLRLQGNVRSGAPEGTVISNQATVQFDSDGNGTEDAAIATNVVTFAVASRDVRATLQNVQLTAGPVVAGSAPGNLVYRLTVTASPTNQRAAWFMVSVTPSAAPGFTLHSATPPSGSSWDANAMQWNTDWLAPGQSAVLDVAMTVAANAPSSVSNTASISGGAFNFVLGAGTTATATTTIVAAAAPAPVEAIPALSGPMLLALAALMLLTGVAVIR